MDGWHIHYNPKPIPNRRHDWDYWHDDCDDGNGLHGTAASRQDAEMAIVEAEEDRVGSGLGAYRVEERKE
jgi:hypothetical protein